jgi:Outer membrane protein beta-barrel domain
MQRTWVCLAALMLAPAVHAAEPGPAPAPKGRWSVILAGMFGAGALSSDESRTFERYSEEATTENAYSAGGGPGATLGVGYRLTPRWGLRLGGRYAARTTTVTATARIPHPLYLDRLREVVGSAADLAHRETSVDLSLTAGGTRGPIHVTLLGGGSLVRLQADVYDDLDLAERYPYDTATIDRIVVARKTGTAPGGHAGLELGYAVSRGLALGVDARYTVAKLRFEGEDGSVTRLTAGGLQVGAGLRLSF